MTSREGPPSSSARAEAWAAASLARSPMREWLREAYAARSGQSEQAYVQQLGDLLTPEIAGSALVDLVSADPATVAPGYLLTAAGLQSPS